MATDHPTRTRTRTVTLHGDPTGAPHTFTVEQAKDRFTYPDGKQTVAFTHIRESAQEIDALIRAAETPPPTPEEIEALIREAEAVTGGNQ